MNEELNQIPGATPDFRTELAEKLAELVPEAVADGKIDTKKLEELLDGDAGDTRERFGLFWPGKKRALRAAQEPTTATLVPDKENSKDWDTTQNVFIEGDNLEVLKILQKHYHGKIKMIYIDPPYNTGKDFVYPDNYQEGLKSYLEFTKQVDEGGKKLSTNSDQAGRYHSNWLNMMYPRLKLARNLLAKDGCIFVSIDDHEQDNLRKLCNEVFGEDNFLNHFLWIHGKGKKDSWSRTAQQYIVGYARNKRHLQPWTETQRAQGSFSNPDGDPRGPWFSGSISFDENRSNKNRDTFFTITSPSGVEWSRQWQVENPAEMQALLEDNLIYFGLGPKYANVPRKKIFPEDTIDVIPSNILENVGTTRSAQKEVDDLIGFKAFDNPKPVALIKKLINISGITSGVILDFFAGSGTTAHAVMEMNIEDNGCRRHVQVQLPEPIGEKDEAYKAGFRNIAEVSRKRIERAAEKFPGDYGKKIASRDLAVDLGFRSYRLSDTNFAKWRLTNDVAETELEQHLLNLRESADDEASQDALLMELLLKRGYSLTEQVDVFDVAGLVVHGVKDAEDDYGLLAYLNEHQKPSLEQLRALVDVAEAQIVILEDAFQGDDQLKTNLAQVCKSKGIELWTA